jgi:hypothetical protein
MNYELHSISRSSSINSHVFAILSNHFTTTACVISVYGTEAMCEEVTKGKLKVQNSADE